MGLGSLVEIVIWGLLAGAACLGSVAHTVAASVSELQPSLLATRAGKIDRLNAAGTIVSIISVALAAAVAVTALDRWGASVETAALGTAISLGVTLTAQGFARQYARRHREPLARRLLGDIAVFLPLIEPREELSEPEQARDETIEQMVDAGEKAGLIESDQREMISGVIGLDRTMAREIMVPRIDVIALDVETPVKEALDVVIEGSHSRVPVYQESIDHIIGVLYAKDLLIALRDGKIDLPLRSLLRQAHFVPESKRLDELLGELQRTKVHMAIVVDEYGGTAGIVTIEDILEEIVGEIQDEYDTAEEPSVERVGENEAIFNARVNIDEVNEELGVNLPGESDTLGGLVYQKLEKMPKVGDQVHVDGAAISVLSVVGRRIQKVRVVKIMPSENVAQNAVDEQKANP